MRVVAVGLLALATAACGGGNGGGATPTPTGGGKVVRATDSLKFEPKDLTVPVGTTVEWKNTGSVAHTVTFKGGSFDEEITGGAVTSFTFTSAGKTDYVCRYHPTMIGTVTVE